jgi:hypothetical protein
MANQRHLTHSNTMLELTMKIACEDLEAKWKAQRENMNITRIIVFLSSVLIIGKVKHEMYERPFII